MLEITSGLNLRMDSIVTITITVASWPMHESLYFLRGKSDQ